MKYFVHKRLRKRVLKNKFMNSQNFKRIRPNKVLKDVIKYLASLNIEEGRNFSCKTC